ncbi:PaaX family transcriptional regulator [Arthrobacter sp. E918]|uniref:PaaX family transcriptional regulator n=2 Tax=Arthrobacter mobilis TaxID=2724944 RepID=A0A7X6K6P2_9MICC|nr:PaaX family transcriptional regulator [Arthrobacter mobilis]
MVTVPVPPLRHQPLILTIYGLYGRRGGGPLPVSVLIEMLGDLGHDAPGVRSAVSRLKAKGVLNSVKNGGVAKYELSPRSLEMVSEGDERIFAPYRAAAGGPWVLAIFSVPETMRDRRHQLRTELTRLGFGSVSPGVWIAPSGVREGAKRRLAARELAEYVEFFTGDYSAEGDMRARVAQWWDLEELAAQIGEFMQFYGNSLAEWTAEVGEDPEAALAASTPELRRDAFRYYVPMLTLWRRLPYRDPGLPLEYLPEDWQGPEARRIFFGVHRLIAPMAEAHAMALVAKADAAV